MRDVNNGWMIRYIHANVASFFFIFVYAHVSRGLYYSSYKKPRILLWSIGVIILILMMANIDWPNCKYDFSNITYITSIMLPINKPRTKAILRIGPHNKEVLDVIICGMLGDFWADTIPGKLLNSTRFQIEQSISNAAYIHYLTLYFYNLGYCARPIPVLVKKTDKIIENRFNYRLTLFSFTTFNWIYDSFYTDVKGGTVIKKIPLFIPEYLTAKGLAHLIMQAGSPYVLEQNTILINTKLANKSEINFIKKILLDRYNIESIVSSNYSNDNVNFNLIIKDLSFFNLTKIIAPHMPLEFSFLLHSDYLSSFVQNSKN